MRKVAYIAGKMTGLPDKGRASFMAAEQLLTGKGYTVLNPARLPDDMPPERYMPICMAMIDQADELVLLGSWLASPGAQLEREYAAYQRKPVRELKELCGK